MLLTFFFFIIRKNFEVVIKEACTCEGRIGGEIINTVSIDIMYAKLSNTRT